MDNVTHTMCGLILAQMGLSAGSRAGAVALVISSNLPDVDVFIELAGHFAKDSIFSHRGITHGLASIPIEAAIVSTSIWALTRSRTKGSAALSWNKLTLLALLALLFHLALDFTNEYGVRILAPFDNSWHSADLTGLVDFWLLMTLSLGFILPILFRGRTSARFPVRTAICCLGLVIAYLGLKHFSHEKALARLDAFARRAGPVRIACFPGSLSPFRWKGVVEDGKRAELLDVHVSARVPSPRQQFEKACPESVRTASIQSSEVRAQLSFARFPHFAVEPWTTDSRSRGYKVHLTDLRWQSSKGYNYGPQVRLWLSEHLAIVKEEVVPWG